MIKSITEKNSSIIWSVLVISLVILAAFFRLQYYGYGSDSAEMLEQIHIALKDGRYTAQHFPPGFGLLAYPLYLITQNIPFSGVLLTFIAYLTIIFFIYRISILNDLNKCQALFITSLVAIHPGLFTQSNNGYSEVLYTCLLLISTYLTIKIIKSKMTKVALTIGLTLTFILMYLIRAEVLFASALLSFYMLIANTKISLSQRIKQVLLFAIPLFCVVLVYTLYIKSTSGSLAVTGKTGDVFFNYGGWVDRQVISLFKLNTSPLNVSSVMSYILSNPLIFSLRVFYNLADLITTILMSLWYIVLPTVIIFSKDLIFKPSLAKKLFNRSYYKSLVSSHFIRCLLVIVVLPAAVLLPFYITERFTIPYSVGISASLAFLIIHQFQPKNTTLSLFLVLASLFSIWNPYDYLRLKGYGYSDMFHGSVYSISNALSQEQWALPYRYAGQWLQQNVSDKEDLKIAAPKKGHTTLAFINPQKPRGFNGIYVQLPKKLSISDLQKKIEKDIDYIVLNKYYTDQELFYTLDHSQIKGIKKLHSDPNKGFIILKIQNNSI